MSCECHFLDADDVPIPAERVRDTIVAHETRCAGYRLLLPRRRRPHPAERRSLDRRHG